MGLGLIKIAKVRYSPDKCPSIRRCRSPRKRTRAQGSREDSAQETWHFRGSRECRCGREEFPRKSGWRERNPRGGSEGSQPNQEFAAVHHMAFAKLMFFKSLWNSRIPLCVEAGTSFKLSRFVRLELSSHISVGEIRQCTRLRDRYDATPCDSSCRKPGYALCARPLLLRSRTRLRSSAILNEGQVEKQTDHARSWRVRGHPT